MNTTQEAIAEFHSHGFPAIPFNVPTASAIRASARIVEGGADYYGEAIQCYQHTFLIFPDGSSWVVRDANWQRDFDERFDSLDKAVAAVIKDFTIWLASDGKRQSPGLRGR